MPKNVLITGGAGFIGAHVANELLRHGYNVRALDNLVPQVHGPERKRPSYLNAEVDLHVGDIRDQHAVSRALRDIEAVVHLVALVGVGQSMYQMDEYTSVNNLGTAVLLQELSSQPVEIYRSCFQHEHLRRRLIQGWDGNISQAQDRTLEQLKAGDWEVRDKAGRPSDSRPDSGGQGARAGIGLRAFEVRSGANEPDGAPRIRDARRGAAFF